LLSETSCSNNVTLAVVIITILNTVARAILLLHDVSDSDGKNNHHYRYTSQRLSLRRMSEKVTKLPDLENGFGKHSPEGHT